MESLPSSFDMPATFGDLGHDATALFEQYEPVSLEASNEADDDRWENLYLVPV